LTASRRRCNGRLAHQMSSATRRLSTNGRSSMPRNRKKSVPRAFMRPSVLLRL
jgi:hypothetical protein